VQQLFAEWLQEHFPQRAEHVLSLIRQSRGGQLNDPRFGSRMRGEGVFAQLLQQRFTFASRKLGLDKPFVPLDTSAFYASPQQMQLFG
jgi:DNA repair photolyase